MKEEKNFDKPIIIERPSLVSKTRHYTEWTIHIIGWILWMLLIRPLIILLLWYLTYRFFKYEMFTLEGIDNPIYFGIGAGILVSIYLIMFVWSRYNAWRFKGKDRRKSRGDATPEAIAEFYKMKTEDISALQSSSKIDIYFLDNELIEIDNGRENRIKALYAPLNQSKHHDKNFKI